MNTQDIDEAVLQVIAASPPERMQEMKDIIHLMVKTFIDIDVVPHIEHEPEAIVQPRRRTTQLRETPPPPPYQTYVAGTDPYRVALNQLNVQNYVPLSQEISSATNSVTLTREMLMEMDEVAQDTQQQEDHEWIARMEQAIQQGPPGSYETTLQNYLSRDMAEQPPPSSPDDELQTALREAQQLRQHDI